MHPPQEHSNMQILMDIKGEVDSNATKAGSVTHDLHQ